MMSVLEYAEDVSKSLEEIMELCNKLEIAYDDENSMLTEDDIIILDNEIQDMEDYIVSEEEEDIDTNSLEDLDEKVEDLITTNNIKIDNNSNREKLKSKKDRIEAAQNSSFKKERKNIYKHRDKLQSNVDESLKKVNEIYDRIKVLNLVDCMFELKTMLEYLDSLFSEFEKERIARKEYEDEIGSFSNKLNKTVSIVKDIYKQIDDIKNMYDLTDNDIQVIDDVNKRLQTLKKDYNKSIRKLSSSKTPYSKINNDLTEYTEKLKYIEDDLDVSLKSLGNMYNDEVRAREQLNDIQDMLSKSKLHMRDYKLPIVSDTYFVQWNEANEAIAEIIKELENKPIAISTLNTRVDTARDLVLKVYNATNDMIRDANICESLIIYCNKYRSGDAKIDREISNAEKLFFKGNYTKAIDTVLNAIDTVDPNIKEKVGKIYG